MAGGREALCHEEDGCVVVVVVGLHFHSSGGYSSLDVLPVNFTPWCWL